MLQFLQQQIEKSTIVSAKSVIEIIQTTRVQVPTGHLIFCDAMLSFDATGLFRNDHAVQKRNPASFFLALVRQHRNNIGRCD